jgi:hypothetical protein
MKTLMAVFLLLAVTGPVLVFDGYDGDHAGQIPLCRNNKTGVIKFAMLSNFSLFFTFLSIKFNQVERGRNGDFKKRIFEGFRWSYCNCFDRVCHSR